MTAIRMHVSSQNTRLITRTFYYRSGTITEEHASTAIFEI
jgi:hypothetical protein